MNTKRYFPALTLAVGIALAAPACGAQTHRYPSGRNGGYGGRNGGHGGNVPRSNGGYPSPNGGYGTNRGAGYGSPAVRNGYRDGTKAGREDARHRDRFDPIRAKRYREGDHDYNRRYGSREEYQREYRAGFEQGYREGYGRAR